MDEVVSQRQFAKLMDRSPSQVRNWISSGRLTQESLTSSDTKVAKIIVIKAKRDLALSQPGKFAINEDPEKKSKTRHNREERAEASEKEEKSFEPPPVNASETTYLSYSVTELNKIKLIREIQMQDMKLKEADGRLVDREDSYKKFFVKAQELRSAFMSMPDRTVDKMISLAKDRNALHHYFTLELEDVLNRLSEDDPI